MESEPSSKLKEHPTPPQQIVPAYSYICVPGPELCALPPSLTSQDQRQKYSQGQSPHQTEALEAELGRISPKY